MPDNTRRRRQDIRAYAAKHGISYTQALRVFERQESGTVAVTVPDAARSDDALVVTVPMRDGEPYVGVTPLPAGARPGDTINITIPSDITADSDGAASGAVIAAGTAVSQSQREAVEAAFVIYSRTLLDDDVFDSQDDAALQACYVAARDLIQMIEQGLLTPGRLDEAGISERVQRVLTRPAPRYAPGPVPDYPYWRSQWHDGALADVDVNMLDGVDLDPFAALAAIPEGPAMDGSGVVVNLGGILDTATELLRDQDVWASNKPKARVALRMSADMLQEMLDSQDVTQGVLDRFGVTRNVLDKALAIPMPKTQMQVVRAGKALVVTRPATLTPGEASTKEPDEARANAVREMLRVGRSKWSPALDLLNREPIWQSMDMLVPAFAVDARGRVWMPAREDGLWSAKDDDGWGDWVLRSYAEQEAAHGPFTEYNRWPDMVTVDGADWEHVRGEGDGDVYVYSDLNSVRRGPVKRTLASLLSDDPHADLGQPRRKSETPPFDTVFTTGTSAPEGAQRGAFLLSDARGRVVIDLDGSAVSPRDAAPSRKIQKALADSFRARFTGEEPFDPKGDMPDDSTSW